MITVETSGGEIVCEYERKRVKNFNLRVRRDGSVYLSAPIRTTEQQARAFVEAHADFIIRAKSRLQSRTERFGYIANPECGEIYVLGTAVTLEIRSTKSAAKAYRCGNSIVAEIPDASDGKRLYTAVDRLLTAEFSEYADLLCKQVFPYFSDCCHRFPSISFRSMKSRWGSCCPSKNEITFAKMLYAQPPDFILDVVIHEFCHFYRADHSPAFKRRYNDALNEIKHR